MRNRLSLGIVTLLGLSLLLSACSAVKDYQQKDDYNVKTEDFSMRMQWHDSIGASLHFQEDLREDFLERFEDWDDFKVTSFAMSRTKSELDEETERKIAYYKVEYYLKNDLKVRKEKIKVIWELSPETDDESAFWRIVEPFPELEVEKE